MTPYANRWSFHLTSSYNALVSIKEKHQRLMSAFARYESPWGVKNLAVPETPEPKAAERDAHLTLTRVLKAPVRYAAITYVMLS